MAVSMSNTIRSTSSTGISGGLDMLDRLRLALGDRLREGRFGGRSCKVGAIMKGWSTTASIYCWI